MISLSRATTVAPIAKECPSVIIVSNTCRNLGLPAEVHNTVDLIDVLWLHPGAPRIACAFEVEKSTSIYSGILRLADIALSLPGREEHLYLVAPRSREREIIEQMRRPMFQRLDEFMISYLLFEDLDKHLDSLCRFGSDHSVLAKLACQLHSRAVCALSLLRPGQAENAGLGSPILS